MENIQASTALEKACNFLISQQKPDGSWPGENFAGPVYTAMCMCTEAALGILSNKDATEGTKSCLGMQLDDGSYPDYLTASKGSLNATVLVYAALKLSGLDDQDPAQLKAMNYIQANGGIEKASFEYQIYPALAGLYDPKKLPSPSILFKLIPGSQMMIGRLFGFSMALVSNAFPLVINGIKNGPGVNFWRCPLNAIASKLALKYLLKTQNPAGNWGGIMMPTLWGMMCMHYMQVPKTDPAWLKACNYLDHWKVYDDTGMRVVPYQSEIWNTSLSVRALIFIERSAIGTNNKIKDSISKGLEYLIANQSELPEPKDWSNPPPGAPLVGGWAYEQDNPLCSDCDTTAAVLWTLSEAKKQGYSVSEEPIEKGIKWLMPMQNKDGGWSAFTHNLKSKPPGPMFEKPMVLPVPNLLNMIKLFLDPPVTLGDPSTSGLTGRVLSALGSLGKNNLDKDVSEAIAFVQYQTASNGAWWGRWEVNFLPATGCVVSGLKAVGASSNAKYLSTGVNWMIGKQNQDGGWGESIESYATPELAGEGPSCGTITGAVLVALQDAESTSTDSIQKGFHYLCEEQNEDGSWSVPYPLHVMFPPNSFYLNTIYCQYSPIVALAKYCHAT